MVLYNEPSYAGPYLQKKGFDPADPRQLLPLLAPETKPDLLLSVLTMLPRCAPGMTAGQVAGAVEASKPLVFHKKLPIKYQALELVATFAQRQATPVFIEAMTDRRFPDKEFVMTQIRLYGTEDAIPAVLKRMQALIPPWGEVHPNPHLPPESEITKGLAFLHAYVDRPPVRALFDKYVAKWVNLSEREKSWLVGHLAFFQGIELNPLATGPWPKALFIHGGLPVFQACATGDLEVVRDFLASGGSVDSAALGKPALAAIALGHGQLEVLQILHKYGLDLNRPFPGHYYLIYLAMEQRREEIVGWLLSQDVVVDLLDAEGAPHFARACAAEYPLSWYRRLIDLGANVNRGDKQGTPLHVAAARENLPLMELLVEAGARVDSRNARGQTPLIEAARLGKANSVSWLLDQGAVPSSMDDRGRTAVDWAEEGNHRELAQLLPSRG